MRQRRRKVKWTIGKRDNGEDERGKGKMKKMEVVYKGLMKKD